MILGKDNIERLPLPVGTSDWATFSRRAYCVDKTLMIKDLIDSETSVALFTRPRRFGKTTAMRIDVCDHVARECRGAGDEWFGFVRAFLDDASADGARKCRAIESACVELGNAERYAEAERLLRKAIGAWKFRVERDRAALWLCLAADRVRFGAFAKMIRGEAFKTDSLFADGGIDAKGRSEIVASLARQALAMDMNGFADGISTEMYFAPGEDVGYQCFGSDAVKGVSWGMNFGYETARSKPLDFSGKTGSGFHSETAFSDTDYVCHFSMDWENFYMRLPADGTDWKFEVIAWTPQGGRTWGGSRSVHCISEWGKLHFALSPADVTAIRRGLLLRTRTSWSTPKLLDGGYALGFFDRWQDDVLGDVEFYAQCLNSLREKLEASVKRISPEMDDKTVNSAFEESLVARLGLRHEIDRLRKRYLLRKLTGER